MPPKHVAARRQVELECASAAEVEHPLVASVRYRARDQHEPLPAPVGVAQQQGEPTVVLACDAEVVTPRDATDAPCSLREEAEALQPVDVELEAALDKPVVGHDPYLSSGSKRVPFSAEKMGACS